MVDQLKDRYMPEDYHHLWSILCRNPDNTVKMSSIITDLKMIPGLYSYELKNICLCVFDILNEIYNDKNGDFYEYDYYRFLGHCYLKYGLDGIQIKKITTCASCNFNYTYFEPHYNKDEFDKKTIEPCYTQKLEYHSIRFETCPGYTILFCVKCGLFKKSSINTPNGLELHGTCMPCKSQHVLKTHREVACPYEEWYCGDY